MCDRHSPITLLRELQQQLVLVAAVRARARVLGAEEDIEFQLELGLDDVFEGVVELRCFSLGEAVGEDASCLVDPESDECVEVLFLGCLLGQAGWHKDENALQERPLIPRGK